jgi:LPXTG-motif cell wall-anchored protein
VKFNRRKRFAVYGGLLMSTAAFMALVNGGSVGALTTTPTTGVGVAADPTTATTATTPSSTAASTTTAVPTTTTTVGQTQTTISGKSNDSNNCGQAIGTAAPTPTKVGVSIAAKAFPQPHEGQPITVSGTTATISIGADTLQAGVTAGVIHDGDTIPSVLTIVISGSHTTEGTKTFTLNSTSTVSVVAGQAQPLVGTSPLPNSTWHPINATDPVFFAEKSVKTVSTILLAGNPLVVTMTCTPSGSGQFLALSATGSAPPVTSGTTAPTGLTVAGATTTTTVAAAANQLPRTGANGVYLLIIAAALVDAGAALLLLTRRRRTI